MERRGIRDDRKGDETQFLREVRFVAYIILIEYSDNPVAIIGYQLVQLSFRCAKPVELVFYGHSIGAHLVAYIEVAVT